MLKAINTNALLKNFKMAEEEYSSALATMPGLETIPTSHTPLQSPRPSTIQTSASETDPVAQKRPRRRLGILSDRHTDEVPGSVLLLSKHSAYNAPLGLEHRGARRSSVSTLPSVYPPSLRAVSRQESHPRQAPPPQKRTADGKIILEPQPEESLNDPLNWPVLRRDAALVSLSFYCMVGGGMTTVLAPAFPNLAKTYNVSVPRVALSTGLYMMGLGVGSVIASPTAILFGKRPVYLAASIIFMLTAIWCALSPDYPSLIVGRVVMGISVSPVECLPSATIAEIFFLHERAYRLGIYTLLLLGGKNLVPLVAAAILQSSGWRWILWAVTIVVAICFFLLFFFVPETFWDRSPEPHHHNPDSSVMATLRRIASPLSPTARRKERPSESSHSLPRHLDTVHTEAIKNEIVNRSSFPHASVVNGSIAQRRQQKHAHFGSPASDSNGDGDKIDNKQAVTDFAEEYGGSTEEARTHSLAVEPTMPGNIALRDQVSPSTERKAGDDEEKQLPPAAVLSQTTSKTRDYFNLPRIRVHGHEYSKEQGTANDLQNFPSIDTAISHGTGPVAYVRNLRNQPPKTFVQALKPWSGRLNRGNWFKFAIRPFILFSYPAILWSAMVYALSVGWLIILSESVTTIYRNKETYNFSALGTGLVYLSPFIGGILGTVVAGRVSDIIVRFMSRHNDGIYEPEFRLVMALPVAVATTIGLMGFGWAAQEKDAWIVPTIFFGIISFGCTLGSTTAITFAVDSYRQFAGEALVTLNFSKNIFDGLVFSLFFNTWLDSDGPKTVFLALGGIELFFLLFTIPMYIYGKRARMWTVRNNFIDKFA